MAKKGDKGKETEKNHLPAIADYKVFSSPITKGRTSLSSEEMISETRIGDKIGIPMGYELANRHGFCCMYVRLFAECFGKAYTPADAWIFERKNESLLYSMRYEKGKTPLISHDIIGIYNPESSYHKTSADAGKDFTHMGYIIVSKEGTPVIYHNREGPKTEKLEDFLKRANCEVREIIRERENK